MNDPRPRAASENRSVLHVVQLTSGDAQCMKGPGERPRRQAESAAPFEPGQSAHTQNTKTNTMCCVTHGRSGYRNRHSTPPLKLITVIARAQFVYFLVCSHKLPTYHISQMRPGQPTKSESSLAYLAFARCIAWHGGMQVCMRACAAKPGNERRCANKQEQTRQRNVSQPRRLL